MDITGGGVRWGAGAHEVGALSCELSYVYSCIKNCNASALLEIQLLLLAMICKITCVEGDEMAHWGMGGCIGRFWQG